MRIQGPSVDAVDAAAPVSRTSSVSAGSEVAPAQSVAVAPSVQALSASQATSAAARAAKLDALKQSIGNGTYKIDRQALSERMADEELSRAGGQ